MDSSLAGTKQSVLEGLDEVSGAPSLVIEGQVTSLKSAADTMKTWLTQERTVSVHLPSIDRSVEIRLQQQEFIEICGNISKEYQRSLTLQGGDPPRYSYKFPASVTSRAALKERY